jgi:hypothetical protein
MKNFMFFCVSLFFIIASVCTCILTYYKTQKVQVTSGYKDMINATYYVDKDDKNGLREQLKIVFDTFKDVY